MISVIIPFYNKSKFIHRALTSCTSQNIKPDEIIIVDDFSELEESKKLKSIIKKFKKLIKINVFSLETNKGPSFCRNFGVKKSKGKIIFFLDADDSWALNKISSHLEIYKDEIIDVVYDNQFHSKNGKLHKIKFKIVNKNFSKELLGGWGSPNLSSLSIRKNIFINIGGLDEKLRYSEDQDLFIKLDQNQIKVIGLNERLTFFSDDDKYRVSYKTIPRIKGTLFFLKKWEIFFRSEFGDGEYNKYRKEYLAKFIYVLVLNDLKNFNWLLATYIFFKYLFLNIEFYKKIIMKIFK